MRFCHVGEGFYFVVAWAQEAFVFVDFLVLEAHFGRAEGCGAFDLEASKQRITKPSLHLLPHIVRDGIILWIVRSDGWPRLFLLLCRLHSFRLRDERRSVMLVTGLFLGLEVLDGVHVVVGARARALLLLDVGALDHEPSFAGSEDAFLAPRLSGQFVRDGLRFIRTGSRHIIDLLFPEPHIAAGEGRQACSHLAVMTQLLDIVEWHIHSSLLRPGEPVHSGAEVLVLGRRLDQLEITAIVQCHVLTRARTTSVVISV